MNWHKAITKNKTFEIQAENFGKNTCQWIDLHISLTRRCNHAGLTLTFQLFSYFLEISILDNRHWEGEEVSWSIWDKELEAEEEDNQGIK